MEDTTKLFSQITPPAEAPVFCQLAVVPSVDKYLPALPVWLGSASTVPHEVVVPLVVKYLPELPPWLGASASNAAEAVAWPVPPFAIVKVPASVIVPDVVMGPPLVVKPVVPPDTATLDTVPAAPELEANKVTTPELFLAYSFMSAVLSANSPLTKLPAVGTDEAVVL